MTQNAKHPGGSSPTRLALTVTGQVQGVGFRPFVYRLAHERCLGGSVRNTPQGVRIELQGADTDLEDFARALQEEQPPLARIVSLEREMLDVLPGQQAFVIEKSSAGEGHNVLISPDTATCPDCLREMSAPDDRRHLYPFTNCTNCGPRYTITRSIPYDRASTSMACFTMCPDCQAEYDNPLDRRFHAQPNACPACGPQVWLTDSQGQTLEERLEALDQLANALLQGKIAAIKGLGGFHLSCLAWGAAGAKAIAALRQRKQRAHKPLALMVPDLQTARTLAEVSPAAEELLSGTRRPIVVCPLRADVLQGDTKPGLPQDVAPDTDQIGLMLPYTPLHFALFQRLHSALADLPPTQRPVPALVMTSGNFSGEPICLGNREALYRLGRIADLFLLHNRDILIRTDDSVLRPLQETDDSGAPALQFFRRARGFTPEPVFLAPANTKHPAPSVMGLGPELKNTLCLTRGDQAFVSQHIGDLENLETLGFFREIAQHLQDVLQTRPELLVRDLHPDYLSSRYAEEQSDIPVRSLQHHFAHIHAVLAEHQHSGPSLGLALDGTGLGDDGTLWGGELLYVDSKTLEHRRLGRFSHIKLPGGEAAIREPWRIAQACLWLVGRQQPGKRPWPWLQEHDRASAMLPEMLSRNLNTPLTSSCGRLFDAVAALLGLGMRISYEGQAAIQLERAQSALASCAQANGAGNERGAYDCPLLDGDGELLLLDTLSLFDQAAHDWEACVPAALVSRRFHRGLIQGLANWAAHAAAETGVKTVALSGGVLQNRTLRLELPAALRQKGLRPLCHAALPPNDGCISLGQAAWGRQLLLNGPEG